MMIPASRRAVNERTDPEQWMPKDTAPIRTIAVAFSSALRIRLTARGGGHAWIRVAVR